MTNTISIETLLKLHARDAAFIHELPSRPNGFASPIIQANEQACELLGYSANELLAMTLTDIIGSHTTGEEINSQLLATGHAASESRFTNKKGLPIPVSVDTHLIETSDGTVCLTTARDISDIQKLKDCLCKAETEIEHALRAKHDFLANMSHELRTPLNGFLGMTQILMGTDLTDSQREYLSLSQDAARRLTKLLTDILSLSSVESGNLEPVSTAFELHPMLESLISPLSKQAASKSLLLTFSIGPEVPVRVKGDSSKLRQILINLLTNAIQFTDKGEVSLEVDIDEVDQSTGTCSVTFKVRDTGIGIPEGKLDGIFDSFSLGENYMTKEYGGAGLGLAISRQLTMVMDGSITVESALGQGSVFTLTLPFQTMHEPVAGEEETPPLNILLAEDEQVNSIMASRLLKKAGHSVTIVGNGQNAIDTLMINAYDLVFMDVQMPVINGMDVTRIIRQGAVEGVARNIPIVGLTAYAGDADRKRFLEAGMDSVVTKPFELADLTNAIKEVTA